MKQIHIGTSPLTNTIFAGNLLKDGRTWASNKQDVTMQALLSVAQHVLNFGEPVIITGGGEVITISVKRESEAKI